VQNIAFFCKDAKEAQRNKGAKAQRVGRVIKSGHEEAQKAQKFFGWGNLPNGWQTGSKWQ